MKETFLENDDGDATIIEARTILKKFWAVALLLNKELFQ